MHTLFYIKVTANYPINYAGKNKRDSFILIFEAISKLSAAANAIAHLHQLGFSAITVDECHRATSPEINAYMACYCTPDLH